MVKLKLLDGSVKEAESGLSGYDIARLISQGLAKAALAVRINGEIKDLTEKIETDCEFEALTFDSQDKDGSYPGRKVFWHTASHILAHAVKKLYPGVKLAIGPAVDNGFYYDFDTGDGKPFSPEDLAKIEKEMAKIVKQNYKLNRFTLPRDEALELVRDEPYKIELINDLPDGEEISFYEQGEGENKFADLCAGPHLLATGLIKALKLLNATGAYWKGSEKNKMLTRIYGVAYPKKESLDEYLAMLEEAKKRDHNKIGRELGYFTTVDYIGQGLPVMMPKGAKVLQILQRFVEDEEEKRGYQLTKTPFMAKSDLYKISGHWDLYRDGMFIIGDENDESNALALRPMTCPFQFQYYLSKKRSYRDLPMRFNETAYLFRNEASGEMHGLIRVRQFTLSEGHIACRADQLGEEFAGCLNLARFMLKTLGLEEDVSYRFSKWDENNKEKYIGAADEWERVQDKMRGILDGLSLNYYEADGEAAFYGPKLDIQIKNVHGKEDTLITLQIDFQLASRFGMEYVDTDGNKQLPYIIHRSSIGCYERTLALLLEKYAGALPTWLAPVQMAVLPIGVNQHEFAHGLAERLKSLGLRAELNDSNETIGHKIRGAQLEKVPYMLIIGDKEIANGEVSVRSRAKGELGAVKIDDFIKSVTEEIANKA